MSRSEPGGIAMRRMLAACALVSMMVAGVMVASPPAGGVAGFGDVDTGRFFTEPVQWMVDNEITTGTSPTCFSPDDPVTRGQAAAFMWRMEGSPPAPPHPFTDIVAPYQQGPVSWMAANNITTGTTPTTYSPDDQLTRGQLAALMHRLAGSPAAAGHPFVDIVKVWQQVPVAWMVANNITTGTSPTMFSPDDTVTRGQLAAFFYRYKGSPPVVVDPGTPGCTVPGTAMNGQWFRFNPAGNSGPDEIERLDCVTSARQVSCDYTGFADSTLATVVGTGEFSATVSVAQDCDVYLGTTCDTAVVVAKGDAAFTGGPSPSVTLAVQPGTMMVVGWDPTFGFHCPWFTTVLGALFANPTAEDDCIGL